MKDMETYIKEVYEKAETMPYMKKVKMKPKFSLLDKLNNLFSNKKNKPSSK